MISSPTSHTITLIPQQVDALLELMDDSENEGPISNLLKLVYNQLASVTTNKRWAGNVYEPDKETT